jgi:biopolymer transport protein ExbD
MASSGSGEEVEVNLTPLLDLVLQLIMFFMITIRLVHYEQSNEAIFLPETSMTLPTEDSKKKNRFPVWVNIDKDGLLVGLEQDPARKIIIPIKLHKEDTDYLKERKEIQAKIEAFFKKKKNKDIYATALAMGLKSGEYKVGVVIRADRRCRYEQVWTIMDIVQESTDFDFWQISVLNLPS